MADAKNTFVLDDGTKEIRLVNTYGTEICTLHIRTGEIGIIDRYNELMRDFSDVVKPLSGINLNSDGTAEFSSDWETLKSVEADLKKRINGLFDMNEADSIFATRNAFSSIGGEFFVEKVLTVLGEVIRKGVEEEAAKAQKRLDKYTRDLAPAQTKKVTGRARTASAKP